MAAPSASTRLDPTGKRLGDGYRTLVTIASDTNINFFEVSVQPPGYDGGEAIDASTQLNDRFRTKSPAGLIELTDMEFEAGYDPVVYSEIDDIINVPTTITVNFPDHSTLAFYGFLRRFIPGALVENEPPTATVTITPTNRDPTTCVEEPPVYVAGAGTGGC